MWDASNQAIRVLLVEDAPFLRHAFGRLLRLHGFEVMEAKDGREALGCVHDFRPDLIVTDLMMPVMDGVELIRRLRADPRSSEVPILVITADPSAATEERARAAGAADFLPKPVDMPALLDRLNAFKVN
jgi:CheY-like chemotaxis protein